MLNVDLMTCSFCPWSTGGHSEPEAIAAWEAHMAEAHAAYWERRNATVAAISSYEAGQLKASAGRLAQHILAVLGLTPDYRGD